MLSKQLNLNFNSEFLAHLKSHGLLLLKTGIFKSDNNDSGLGQLIELTCSRGTLIPYQNIN